MIKIARICILCCLLGAALAGAPPTVTLLSPAGGENWVIGTEHGIAWTTIKGHPGTAYVNLWGYNAANQLIHLGSIAAVDYQKGGFVWKAGTLEGRKVGPGRYHVRITVLCPSLPKMLAWNPNPFQLGVFRLPGSVQRN